MTVPLPSVISDVALMARKAMPKGRCSDKGPRGEWEKRWQGEGGRWRKEAPMRIRLLWILTIATVLTASPARAQTYDPGYPVSMQAYGLGGGHIDCS
jgi:hypothetical protein